MRKDKLTTTLLLACITLLGVSRLAHASAEVLPKGRVRFNIDSRFYLPIDKRLNPDGNTEDVATDFNGPLDSNVFTDLRGLELFFGLPEGSANLGDTVVSFKYDLTIVRFSAQYGLTKRLTLGILIPYWWMKNKVDARLDTTAATVGINSTIGSLAPLPAPGVEGPVPGIPFGITEFLTKEDIQQILGDGLDINGNGTIDPDEVGFGFKRFETWSGNGIGDIEAGFRYQYLKTEDWQLAFTGGMRFPTGRVDDPDNLVDYPFGSGAFALLFRLDNDFKGIKNLVLSGTFSYDLVLPDKQTLRVPENVNEPITRVKTKVNRDLGDVFKFEISALYTILKGLSLYGYYEYGFALKDRVSGDGNFAFESLEDETDWTSHIVKAGVSYSTLPLFLQKQFPLPLSVGVFYRNRFAGTNNVLKSQYISFELTAFF